MSELSKDILWETENLLLKVSRRPLVVGELWLDSKKQISCMAELEEDVYLDELLLILKKISLFYRSVFNKNLVWYEEGKILPDNRARIVCLPINEMILKTVINDLGNPSEIEYFEDWSNFYLKNKRYYLINQYESSLIFRVKRAKRDYFNKVIMRKLKIKDKSENWDNEERDKATDKLSKDWKRWSLNYKLRKA